MLFHSLPFLLFVVVVLVVHGAVLRMPRAQQLWLLAASWFFYATWSSSYVALLIVVTWVNFAVARELGRSPGGGDAAGDDDGKPDGPGRDDSAREGARRRALLLLGIAANLAPLLLLKYARFFWGQLALLAPLPPPPGILRFAVPVGIAFYTLHALSYVIDAYRRAIAPSESFVDVALFLAFFPQVIAGPIGRWGAFASDLARPAAPSAADLEEVAFLLTRGLVKKVVLADVLGTYVDPVYGGIAQAGAAGAAFAFYAYPFQLYLDFSGYTDVARALARLFGYRLPENFDSPYLAIGPADYWRRWHISLSTWLRDYLFFPTLRALDRRAGASTANTVVAHLATMLLSGLWHGAGWNFIAWGGLHGAWLALHRTWIERAGRRPRTPAWWRWLATFHATCATLVVFRAPTLSIARELFSTLAALRPAARAVPTEAVVLVVGAFAAHVLGPRLDVRGRWSEVPPALQGLAYGIAIALVAVFSGRTEPFIYFQF